MAASMVDVMKFFGWYPSPAAFCAFRADWAKLGDADKTALRQGIGDGSLTY